MIIRAFHSFFSAGLGFVFIQCSLLLIQSFLVILQPFLRPPAGQTVECNFAVFFFWHFCIYLLLKPEALSIFKCSQCHQHGKVMLDKQRWNASTTCCLTKLELGMQTCFKEKSLQLQTFLNICLNKMFLQSEASMQTRQTGGCSANR